MTVYNVDVWGKPQQNRTEKEKKKMTNKIKYTKALCICFLIALVASTVNAIVPTVSASAVTFRTCDSAGNTKTTFNPGWSTDGMTWNGGENVYFTASGLSASTTYPIYVFIKNDSWTTGMAFPTRWFHTESSITADSSGNIVQPAIYTRQQAANTA
jgi:hypothetical protein